MLALAMLLAAAAHGPGVRPPPIITPLADRPYTESYGDWTVAVRPKFIAAYTSNGSHGLFGVACGETCVAYTTTDIDCSKGHVSPGLVSSPAGGFSVSFRCAEMDSGSVLVTEFGDPMMQAMEIGGTLGIVTPMANGQFNVSRYSLTGAMKAVARAAELSSREKKGGQDLKDFTL